jgi:hypothetical protein
LTTPSSADVKNGGVIFPLPHISWHGAKFKLRDKYLYLAFIVPCISCAWLKILRDYTWLKKFIVWACWLSSTTVFSFPGFTFSRWTKYMWNNT